MKKSKKTAKDSKEYKDSKAGSKGNMLPSLLSGTWRSIKENWHLSILNIVVDLLFLLLLSFSTVYFSVNAMESATKLMELGGEMTGGITNIYNQTDTVSAGLLEFQKSADVNKYAGEVLKYIIYIILTAFLVWIVLQGISWYIAYRISTDKQKRIGFLRFMKNFALETIPFYLIYCIMVLMMIFMMVRMATTLFPAVKTSTMNLVFYVLAVITAYFCFLTFTFTGKGAWSNIKSGFKQGVLKFSSVIWSFCFIFVLVLAIDFLLLIPVMTENVALTIIIGTIIFAAALALIVKLPRNNLLSALLPVLSVLFFVLYVRWKAATYFDTIDPFYYITVGLLMFLLTVFFVRILLFKTRQQCVRIQN